jgi:taurine dioxygenase
MNWEPSEIVDFDASHLADREYMTHLVPMLEDHQLLILRGQEHLSLKDHLALTSHFGAIAPSLAADTAHPSSSGMQLMERLQLRQAPRQSRISSSYYWHTDRSFLQLPPAVTTLHAQILPAKGGDTLFANMVNAYEVAARHGLPIDDVRAVHSYASYFRDLQPMFYDLTDISKALELFPDVTHPLVRIMASSRKRALHLSELCLTHLVGLPEKEGADLLDSLYKIALDPANIYSHRWHAGDLLIWSNFGVMHRGNPCEGARRLNRTVAGQLAD